MTCTACLVKLHPAQAATLPGVDPCSRYPKSERKTLLPRHKKAWVQPTACLMNPICCSTVTGKGEAISEASVNLTSRREICNQNERCYPQPTQPVVERLMLSTTAFLKSGTSWPKVSRH